MHKQDCKLCGASYSPTSRVSRYCSDNCRKIVSKEAHSKWQQANPHKIKGYIAKYRTNSNETYKKGQLLSQEKARVKRLKDAADLKYYRATYGLIGDIT